MLVLAVGFVLLSHNVSINISKRQANHLSEPSHSLIRFGWNKDKSWYASGSYMDVYVGLNHELCECECNINTCMKCRTGIIEYTCTQNMSIYYVNVNLWTRIMQSCMSLSYLHMYRSILPVNICQRWKGRVVVKPVEMIIVL